MPMLVDGFNTTYAFPGAGVTFIEKEVTPPALDGGGEIPQTAMRNVLWRTAWPKYLRTLGKMDSKVKYDPFAYSTIQAQINRNQAIVLNFPSLTMTTARRITLWGWLNKFAPEALKEGDEPLADMEILISNLNDSQIETGPVFA